VTVAAVRVVVVGMGVRAAMGMGMHRGAVAVAIAADAIEHGVHARDVREQNVAPLTVAEAVP
jgi:hypothetical protein